jgi:hypothetical protein
VLRVHGIRGGQHLKQLDADGLVEGMHQTRSYHSLASTRALKTDTTIVSKSSNVECDPSPPTHQVVEDGVFRQRRRNPANRFGEREEENLAVDLPERGGVQRTERSVRSRIETQPAVECSQTMT